MTSPERIRARHIGLMQKTLDLLDNVLRMAPHADLTRFTDGPDGWNVLEILCHLRDFDQIFYDRVQCMLREDHPQLAAYDHEALVEERQYRQQDPARVHHELVLSRARFVQLFESLSPEQWERTGVHPESGEWSITDALMQVGHHDVTHLEQITRVLSLREG